jgi:hypothetical protein
MNRVLKRFLPVTACVLASSLVLPAAADAQRWEVRREAREGRREVNREKYEAYRELKRCTTRECAAREVREGRREVSREKREARREVRREVRDSYRDSWYRGGDRWYRDGRYWDRSDYERRYYSRDDRDDGGDVVAGVLVGAAVIGVVAAIADADKNDD